MNFIERFIFRRFLVKTHKLDRNHVLTFKFNPNTPMSYVSYIKRMLINGNFNHTVVFLSGEQFDIEIYDRINKRFV